jgi:segregation and condensation protein B
MRPPFLGLGRLLGSVAERYRHGGAAGIRTGDWAEKKRPPRLRIGLDGTNFGGAVPPNDQLVRLEAVFFLSQQPQSSRKLAQLAGLADGTKARTLVRTLNHRYDAEGSAFRIEEVAGGFQLLTRPMFAPWLRRLHSAPAEVRLSVPAMETLAVVAYRQPVLRAEIEAIRGVQSGEVLRQLIERGLVRIVGRSDELGRPFLYGTTKQFLQVFGLRNLDELPRADVLRTCPSSVTPPSTSNDVHIGPAADSPNPSHQSPVAEEETNVSTLITTEAWQGTLAEEECPTATRPYDDPPGTPDIFDKKDEDEDDDELDEEEDFEEEEDDDEEEEEEDDEDLDDEPWEEVDDEDEDEDLDEDEDEDEDWDDEDEDWDDEDEDWEDEDEDEDWDDEEEDEKEPED